MRATGRLPRSTGSPGCGDRDRPGGCGRSRRALGARRRLVRGGFPQPWIPKPEVGRFLAIDAYGEPRAGMTGEAGGVGAPRLGRDGREGSIPSHPVGSRRIPQASGLRQPPPSSRSTFGLTIGHRPDGLRARSFRPASLSMSARYSRTDAMISRVSVITSRNRILSSCELARRSSYSASFTTTQIPKFPACHARSDTTDSHRFDVRRIAGRLCHEGSGGTGGPGRAFGITSPPGRPARLSIGIPAVYREGKARITGWGRRSGVLGMRAGPSFSAGSGRPAPARAFRVSVADLTSRSEARNSGRRSFDRGGALLPSERDATLRTARSGSRR